MSVLIQGSQLRSLLLGVRVAKSLTAPQTTSTPLFTVTGGKVAITSVVGEVTTVIGATTVNYNVTYTPSGGAAADLCAATACTSDAVGTIYSLVSGVATDLLSIQSVSTVKEADSAQAPAIEVPNVTFAQLLRNPFVVRAGALNWKTSASTTGAVAWTLTYIPVDDGASVAAA